ncbi:hypothetical protein GIB67_005118 [Kingdonia uniflora]|uniref:Alpha-1,3-mannosyl-glycoprotein 2-beta-N-acetylglucosaminyltransferase n=1 Tax=Kingdonia uniflora TaxID=39325 RepID=A0A7J7PD06_9MAGN|nr:hypothetical protein GIB67_005118 [Kingdonia uniflora]
MSYEEVMEAGDDYYQMVRFHYQLTSEAGSQNRLRLLAKEAVTTEDEAAGVYPRESRRYPASDTTKKLIFGDGIATSSTTSSVGRKRGPSREVTCSDVHYQRVTFLELQSLKLTKTHLNQEEKLIKYSDFVNKELILFSMADLQRSIPSMVDGLKPEQRKIIFCSFKQNFTNEAKVAQFSGYVSGHSAYHHGEQNLAGTIIGMAQDFVGSNNINLLQLNGIVEASEGGFDPKETMARYVCEVRILLFAVAAAFIYIQMRFFGTQSGYSDRLAAAVESESYCTSEVRLLIDQISTQQERIVSLEEKKKSQDQECGQLRALVHDLERKAFGFWNSAYRKAKIGSHYKWALDGLFYKHNFTRVIILEDDKEISPDFFDYFEAAATLMDKDRTIMAVSSWNDNGQKQFVHDPKFRYRSDFFPGLGWMLTNVTWDELSPKWPKAYWDDWLRLKTNHKDRQFICLEVCRTYNFGEHGSSMGQFFKQYLEPIKLNDVHDDWKSMDLSYLTEGNYLRHFANIVSNAKPVYGIDIVLKAYNIDGDVCILYRDQEDFERITR